MDSPPATGHQCLLLPFDFYLAYYGLISSQWTWGHFEAPWKTELPNGIRAPFTIHLFFISLMRVPASGSTTRTAHQFFSPSCCPFHVSAFQFPLFLFRLWITQLPHADTIWFPFSLAFPQLYKHPLMPVSLLLSQSCMTLSSQLLAYSPGPSQPFPPLHTNLWFCLQGGLYGP